jgi:hypothetical protein
MLGQVPGGRQQRWCQPFSTDIIQAFPDQPNGIVHPYSIGLPTLLGARVPPEVSGVQQAQQTFPMHTCHGLHFIEQAALLSTSGEQVPSAHQAKVLAALRNRHIYLVLHGSLSNIVS